MKSFLLKGLTISALCVSVLFGAPPAKNDENTHINKLKQLKNAFATTKGNLERRQLVLQAIDEDVIHRWQPISEIRDIFGDQFVEQGRNADDTASAYVNFTGPKVKKLRAEPDGTQTSCPAVSGWTIYFTFDSSSNIKYYSLSNIHK